MGVFQGRSRGFAVILEQKDVFEAAIFFEIEDAVAKGPQDVFDSLWRECCEAGTMVRRLDDHFVSADAVHSVEHAFGLAVERAFNPESGKFVWYHAYGPSRGIALRCRSAVRSRTIRLNLRRGLALVPVAKRAEATFQLDVFSRKIGRPLGAIGRNNHPAANNRIFSKLRHSPDLIYQGRRILYFTPRGRHYETLLSAAGWILTARSIR